MSDQALALPRPRTTAAPATIAIVASTIALAALRIAILFRYRIDSDETQHLHVVWGWTHGLLQYRDVFDNHMPLFHILSIPLLLAAGERPETLIIARLAMLLLFALVVSLTYRVAASCWEQRSAAWATAIGILTPVVFLCSVEFRPDVLWAACWLAALAILAAKPVTLPRAAAAGLLLGLAAAVSAKTALLAVSLGIAALVTAVLLRDRSLPPRAMAARSVVFTAAALLPPALIAAWFAAMGAWEPFVHCTITHNLVATEHPHRTLFIIPCTALIALAARRLLRDEVSIELRRRRLFLFLAASIYGALLVSFWPIIEREHWLPFWPAFAAATIPLLASWSGPRWRSIAVAIVIVESLWIVRVAKPFSDQTVPSMETIEQTMMLTTPGERVVDLKGELVFRRRATRAVFEKITKRAISSGRLRDTVAEDVVRTGTMVAVPDDASFPRRGREFLRRNFIDAGALRVAGMVVPRSGTFRIELPGDYGVVSPHGSFHGTLDGTPYSGPRHLDAGVHTLEGSAAAQSNAVIWSRAAAHGLTPFRRLGR